MVWHSGDQMRLIHKYNTPLVHRVARLLDVLYLEIQTHTGGGDCFLWASLQHQSYTIAVEKDQMAETEQEW